MSVHCRLRLLYCPFYRASAYKFAAQSPVIAVVGGPFVGLSLDPSVGPSRAGVMSKPCKLESTFFLAVLHCMRYVC